MGKYELNNTNLAKWLEFALFKKIRFELRVMTLDSLVLLYSMRDRCFFMGTSVVD